MKCIIDSLYRQSLLLCIFFLSLSLSGQFLIDFPVFSTNPTRNPQNLIVCNGQSRLQVSMSAITASTTGATVNIQLPSGIEYVSGSITTVSSNAGLTIIENGGTPNAPSFRINGNIVISNNIVFTISRRATCLARTAVLDGTVFTDSVTGTMGDASTNKVSGSYDVTYPVLTFTQPTTRTNAVVGATYTRTFTVTNGGNGAANTIYLSIDYPSNGIEQTSLQITSGNGATGTPITLTPTSVSGTTRYFTIPSTNLSGGNLDNGEALIFTETYRVKVCSPSTSYAVGWGCSATPASWCDTRTGTGSVTMATGVPDVRYVSGSAVKVRGANMCDNAITTTIIRNQGNETVAGAGTAFNLTQFLGMDLGESIVLRPPLSITNIQLYNNTTGTWVNLLQTGGSNGVPASVNFNQLTGPTDPDGVGVGLIDADGDGQYDDLPVGQQILLRYEIVVPCQPSCANQTKSGLPSYRSSYTNQCGGSITGTQSNGPSTLSAGDRFSNSNVIAPADIANGETATIRINGSRDFSSTGTSIYSCPTNRYTLKIVTPKGFTITGGRFYRNGVGTTDVSGTGTIATISGATTDTHTVIGLNSPGTAYSFEADLRLDCGTYNEGEISYTIEYLCDANSTCGCVEILSCGTIPVLIHCPNPCPDGGLTATAGRFQRTSLGYATPTSTTTFANPASLSATQLATVLPFDGVKAVFDGVLYPNTTVPAVTFNNHYFSVEYPRISSQNILAPNGGGTFTVTNSITGVVQTCTIPAPMSNTVVGNIHKMVYDLSSSSCGLTINVNDKVHFEPNFTVVNNTGFGAFPTQVSGLVTKFYSTSAANVGHEYRCDTFSGQLMVHRYLKRRYDGTGNIINNGCNSYTYSSEFNLDLLNYDIYPREIRPFVILDYIVVESLGNDNFTGTATLRSYGTTLDGYATATSTNTNIASSVTYTNNNKTARFTNPGTWPMGDIANSLNVSGYGLSVGLINGCESSANGSVRVTYYFKDNGYAHNNPSVQTSGTNAASRGVQNTLSSVTLTNQSGTIQASQITESFVVQLSNQGTVATPYTWLSIPANSGYTITRVVDIATNTALTLLDYNTGSGVWAQLGTSGLTSGQTKSYRIDFTYTACTQTNIRVYAGWNCAGYPTGPISPAYACTPTFVDLPFIPQPGFVQVISVQQPTIPLAGLCEPLEYIFKLNSAGAGSLKDMRFQINQITGLQVDLSSIQVQYPSGTGSWGTASTSVSGNAVIVNLSSYNGFPITTGLPGTLDDGGNQDNRQINVRFRVTTNCNFVSGSNFTVVPFANNICGSTAVGNGARSATQSITVAGAEPSYLIATEVTANPDFNGCHAVTLPIRQTIITNTQTTATGTIRVDLPAGFDFASSPLNCSAANCPTVDGVYTDASTNTRYLILNVPPNLVAGQVMEYSVNITQPNSSCGDQTILIRGLDKASNISCPTAPTGVCDNVIIQTGYHEFDFSVNKPVYQIQNMTISSGSTVTGTVQISNTASFSSANPIRINFYCADAAGNPSTTLLGTAEISAIAAGTTTTQNYSFTRLTTCGFEKVYAVIEQGNNCICSQTNGVVLSLVCYRPGATGGVVLNTNHGISALGRAGTQNTDNWPMVRKGAWTALEAKTKGFVVNRIPTTAQVESIANPIEGMMVYDEQADCLKIYTSTDGGVSFGWKCYTSQTCPE